MQKYLQANTKISKSAKAHCPFIQYFKIIPSSSPFMMEIKSELIFLNGDTINSFRTFILQIDYIIDNID